MGWLENMTDEQLARENVGPVDLSIERSNLQRMGRYSRRSFELLHVKNALLRLEALEIEGV